MIVCKNCGTPLSKAQASKKGSFCSKACATPFRCKAWDPDFFTSDIHIVSYLVGLLFTDGNLNKEKTKIKPFPDLSKLDQHDFLRGVFDGDGCIYCSSQFKTTSYYAFSITVASKLFAEGLMNQLEMIGLKPHLVEDSRRRLQEITTFSVKIYTQEEIQKFAQYIYHDAYIKNNIKFERFQNGDMI